MTLKCRAFVIFIRCWLGVFSFMAASRLAIGPNDISSGGGEPTNDKLISVVVVFVDNSSVE